MGDARWRPCEAVCWWIGCSGSQPNCPSPTGGGRGRGDLLWGPRDGNIFCYWYNKVQLKVQVPSCTHREINSFLQVYFNPMYCHRSGKTFRQLIHTCSWKCLLTCLLAVPWKLVSIKFSWKRSGRSVVLSSKHVMIQQGRYWYLSVRLPVWVWIFWQPWTRNIET